MESALQIRVASVLMLLAVLACSGLALPFAPSAGTDVTPAVLARCDPNPTSVCLIGFGTDLPDTMTITLFVPPAQLRELYIKAESSKGVTERYACEIATDATSTVTCAGALVPLGSTINVGVYASAGNVLLARGDVVVNALALPTAAVGGAPAPTGVLLATRTPTSATSTASAATISTPSTATSTGAGTGYPNP